MHGTHAHTLITKLLYVYALGIGRVFFDQIFHILTQFLMQTRKKLFKGSSNHPIIVYTHTCIQMMRKIEVDVPQTATNVRDEYIFRMEINRRKILLFQMQMWKLFIVCSVQFEFGSRQIERDEREALLLENHCVL